MDWKLRTGLISVRDNRTSKWKMPNRHYHFAQLQYADGNFGRPSTMLFANVIYYKVFKADIRENTFIIIILIC